MGNPYSFGKWKVDVEGNEIYGEVSFVSIPTILNIASSRFKYNSSIINRLLGRKKVEGATLYTKKLPPQDSSLWKAAENNNVKIEQKPM